MTDPNAEIAELETQMQDTREWFHNEAAQARYGDLIEAREAGATAPPVATQDVDAQAEKLIKSPDYWKSEAKQAEVRALYEGKTDNALNESSELDFEAVANNLHLETDQVETLASTLDELEAAFGESAADVVEAFNGLPDRVAGHALRELGLPAVADAKPFDSEQMTDFAKSKVGRVVVPLWGGIAPAKLGRAMARWDRLVSNFSEDERGQWNHFYQHGLDTNGKVAVTKALAR